MSRQLPLNPSIEQLKKQAKDLRKAHASADPEAAKSVQAYLPRLADTSEEEVLAAEFSLQEAQHVLACEYGFKNWNWLQVVVEIDLDLLVGLTDREVQVLMREVDHKDLVVSLKTASDGLKEKVLGNMSERVRQFITEEMEFLGPMPEGEVREAQRRVLLQTAALAAQGQVDWPNGNGPALGKGGGPEPFRTRSELSSLLGRHLDQLSPDEVVDMWGGLGEQARVAGVLSLESSAEQAADPFVREAVRLAVDGAEPELIRDILETRSKLTLLPQQEVRGRMVIEALMSILAGDNPRIVHHKLGAMYQSEPSGLDRSPVAVPIDELTELISARLRGTPYARMEFDRVDALFTDMSSLARRAGLAALAPLIEVADAPLLRRGLEMIRDECRPEQFMEAIVPQLDEELRQTEGRHGMVIAGIEALQMGRTPHEIAETVRQVGP